MRNVQSAPKGTRDNQGSLSGRSKLAARILWIMSGTTLATFGILAGAYQLLF